MWRVVCRAVLAWAGRSVGALGHFPPILPCWGPELRQRGVRGREETTSPTEVGFGGDLRAEGRRTLSWLIVLDLLRRSVLLAVVGAVGIVGNGGLCKPFRLSRDLPAACVCLSVRCVVARVCGCRALRCCRCWCVWVLAVCAWVSGGGGRSKPRSQSYCGVGVKWGLGVILVPPSCLLLKFLAALVLSWTGGVEGSGRGRLFSVVSRSLVARVRPSERERVRQEGTVPD